MFEKMETEEKNAFLSCFAIHQRVTIGGDIQALVTAIQFQGENYVLIKCEWISAGNVNSAWFDEKQLEIFMEER